jgi:hypothetical protein
MAVMATTILEMLREAFLRHYPKATP